MEETPGRLRNVALVAFAMTLLAASPAAAQGCSAGCIDRCRWNGYGYECAFGKDGCGCTSENGVCMIAGCDKTEEEDDEEDAAVAVRQASAVHLLDVGGQLFVAFDACPKRPPVVLRFAPGSPITIVRPLARVQGG
jgi:hypothetical protein